MFFFYGEANVLRDEGVAGTQTLIHKTKQMKSYFDFRAFL